MDLNSIDLPASVIVELYGDTLIDTAETVTKSQPIITPSSETVLDEEPKWLGNNNKKILILVRYPDSVYMPDAQLSFLTAMLSACKLDIGDVAIVNLAKRPGSTYKELISQFSSRIVLLFSIEPVELGLPINFPQFQIQPFASNSFLYSPSLQDLEADKILKSKLWVCLRRLFNI